MKRHLKSRARNCYLIQGRQQFASTRDFAEYLGVTVQSVRDWVGLRRIPSPAYWECNNGPEIKEKFQGICGVPIEMIFPAELRQDKKWLAQCNLSEELIDLPIEILLTTGAVPPRPTAPDEILERAELKRLINACLVKLEPIEAAVITLRFGLSGEEEHTLEAIGEILGGLKAGKIKRLERAALWKLRRIASINGMKE